MKKDIFKVEYQNPNYRGRIYGFKKWQEKCAIDGKIPYVRS